MTSQEELEKMMTSRLVETVSINYDDFSESFLTCGTCMCTYDSQEHIPKLLPCSHTVCRLCLERIVEAQTRDTASIRCPICRDVIQIPRGGVATFPPSFLVNQLMDLMARQRRDIIPKCSIHSSQELLFCETCDIVFCTVCTGGTHCGGNHEHTVIPFSIAIKRMSEILLHKANRCLVNLTRAQDNVTEEMRKLDANVDRTFELVNRSFQDLIGLLERRRHEVLQHLQSVRDEKRKVLREQLDIIQGEKDQVERDCGGLHYQVEVRNITKKISDLNEKLDATTTLIEPRENAFVRYEHKHNAAIANVEHALRDFGRVRVSKTFPALCTARYDALAVTHLEWLVRVGAVDYHGDVQTEGGDPLFVDMRNETGDRVEARVRDSNDGSYTVRYTPHLEGTYKLFISIFDRPIRGSPFKIDVTETNNPVLQCGDRGSGEHSFIQPVGIAVHQTGNIYVTDTGNSRIKVLTDELHFLKHIASEGLRSQSATGIAITPSQNLVVVNWRTKQVTEITPDGKQRLQFTCADFIEPVCVAVNSRGEVVVGDSGAHKVFIFDATGKLLRRIGSTKGEDPGQFSLIAALAIGANDDVVVADSRLQIFGRSGKFNREIYPEGKGKGQYGGIVVDRDQRVLVTRSERGRNFVQLFTYSGKPLFQIDSLDAKLKRPAGLAVTHDHHVVIVDLGNDCVKKYRYK
ncbi:PREDICTED: tripartite motif-containing protein 2-like isoform X3 [Priapulus caudatus]|uniref:Tripartite motif-containing protein 2-like isoform X2 n=1 Tax=Priapulus caudatus TaxID=37621 RepID=A0ABM1FBB7_PRICU|nr:PREDICTED: tripartite motif-containing protein 2-like isoform X2 [Priapulus caudatus]XP_014681738.1 PREDICTED: tripartite motif-containing protein 2-like isoform X3 [Priapulus caudatus]